MFGIPEWFLVSAVCFVVVVLVYLTLVDRVYLTHLEVPESIEWDEQPGMCDECMGGAVYTMRCEHWGACHH